MPPSSGEQKISLSRLLRPTFLLLAFAPDFACNAFPTVAAEEGVTPVSSARAAQGRNVWITMLWEITIARNPERFELLALLPRTVPGRQDITAVYLSRKPERTYSKDGNLYARWLLNNPGNDPYHILAVVQATLYPFRLADAAASASPPGERALRRDRSPERMMESDAPEIREAAAGISDGSTQLQTVRNIETYVCERLQYQGFVAQDGGALDAFRSSAGDCTDYVDLFVALCRAKGIPARHLSGVLTQWVTVPGHSWAEFYTPETGWALTDPLHADLGKATFGNLEPKYLQLSSLRNDERLNDGMLYRWSINGAGGAGVSFICSERAESPLASYPDITWLRLQ